MQMITLCVNIICKRQSVIFNDCLKEGKFPSDWKKVHVVPAHKKGDKLSEKTISLFPICSKLFERLIYNELFTFVTDNKLISPNQSGFRPGDLCVNSYLLLLMKYVSRLMTDLK